MRKKPSYIIETEQIIYLSNVDKVLQMKDKLIEYIFDREFHNCLGESEDGHEMWISDGTEFPINNEYESILNKEVFLYSKLIRSVPPTDLKEEKRYERLLERTNIILEETTLRNIIKDLEYFKIEDLKNSGFEITNSEVIYG